MDLSNEKHDKMVVAATVLGLARTTHVRSAVKPARNACKSSQVACRIHERSRGGSRKSFSFTSTTPKVRKVSSRSSVVVAAAPNSEGIVKADPSVEYKGKIAVLIEEHYDPFEFRSYNNYYPAIGYDVEYITHLWGNPTVVYTSNPTDGKIEESVTVTKCVTKTEPSEYKGIMVIGAYAMDRLRYQVSVAPGQPNMAPAVVWMRKAMAENIVVGHICHSLWLFCAAPELLKGRKVTCAHNIVCDVENAGGDIVYEGDGTAEIVVDGNLVCGKHPGMLDLFNSTFEKVLAEGHAVAA